jgi:hypothetical protein
VKLWSTDLLYLLVGQANHLVLLIGLLKTLQDLLEFLLLTSRKCLDTALGARKPG